MFQLSKLFPSSFLFICFLLLIMLYVYNLIPKRIENMVGSECNLNLGDKSPFCTWNVSKSKCECAFQKDRLNYIFPIPNTCCPIDCGILSKDQCISRGNNDTDTETSYYYCPNKGVCERLIAYQDADRVSSNFCGIDPLTNQLVYPYLTSEECTSDISQCSKYANLSVNEKKSKCLADTNCGWCTNSQGIGDCIEGTASGPVNLYKYNFCLNDSTSDDNKYTYTSSETDISTESMDFGINTSEYNTQTELF